MPKIKSLQEICEDVIRKTLVGKIDTLRVLELANELNLPSLRADCLGAIRFKYSFFKEIAEDGYLLELCGKDEIAEMENAQAVKEQFIRVARQEGTILERRPTRYSISGLSAYDNDGQIIFFPKEALISGVKWPEGIDPAKRESWLSDEDFRAEFGMTKESFYQLAPHKRERLKKEKNLW